MIRVVKFEPEHLYKMDLLEVFQGDKDVRERVRDHSTEPSCVCSTLLCPDGSVLGVVGMTLVTDGYGSLWSLLSQRVKDYPVGFHKCVKWLINHFWVECNLYRIDTHVEADNLKACKQNELWGLTPEARLKRTSPRGKDEIVFSRVRDGR